MNKRVVRRLLETFFRRWWLYLLPLVLFAGVGAMKSVHSGSGFQSVGVIDVSHGTLLSQLTSIRGETFGYETPASSTSRTMNSLLRTDNFLQEIADSAGIGDQLKSGQITPIALRQSIYSSPDGDTLLQVVATTEDPQLSAKLAQATIDSFVKYVVAGDVSESKAAETFFADQLTVYQKALDDAHAALNAYATAHPGGPLEQRPLAEQIEIQRLTSEVQQAETQYTTAQGKSEEARLATEQATSDVSQRLRIVDSPEVPSSPEPRLKQAVMTFAVFLFVGLLLSIGAVVLGTVTDRSMRSPEDVEQLLGLPVLAVVPDARLSRKGRHSKVGSPIKASIPPKKAIVRAATPAKKPSTKAISSKSSAERTATRRAGASVPANGRSDVAGPDDLNGEHGTGLDPATRAPRGGPDL